MASATDDASQRIIARGGSKSPGPSGKSGAQIFSSPLWNSTTTSSSSSSFSAFCMAPDLREDDGAKLSFCADAGGSLAGEVAEA